MRNILRTVLIVALAALGVSSTSCAATPPDGVTKARLGSLRRDDLVVVDVNTPGVDTNAVVDLVNEHVSRAGMKTNDVESIVGRYYETNTAVRIAALKEWQLTNALTRADAASGLSSWLVSFADMPPDAPDGAVPPSGAVVGVVMADGYPTGLWSLFPPDDTEHSGSSVLANAKPAPDDVLELSWAADETSWGGAAVARRIRIPTMAELESKASTGDLQVAVVGLGAQISENRSAAEAAAAGIARLSDEKAASVVRDYVLGPPLMDLEDVWVVDADGTVLHCAATDDAAGLVAWVGTNACNSLWVSGQQGAAPASVEYRAVELSTPERRVFASLAVRDVATGDACGVRVADDGGFRIAYPAEDFEHFSDGTLQYMYDGGAAPVASRVDVSYVAADGTDTNITFFSRGRLRPVETHVVYSSELGAAISAIGDGYVSRRAFSSGFTDWAVTPDRALDGDVVVAPVGSPSPQAVARSWSLFYAADPVRDESTRLAEVKTEAYNATNIAWSAEETKWGVPVRATRVRVPTMSDITALQEGVDACNEGVDVAYLQLMHYATNNYKSARMANERVKEVEAWQHTNALMRTDLETGLTGWAITPRWPVGYMDVRQVEVGPDAGKWSLFSPTDTVHSAETAIARPVDGVVDQYGDVTDLKWVGVRWEVDEKWTNSLDTLGLQWAPGASAGVVVATFDARASRVRVPTWRDVAGLAAELTGKVSADDFTGATNTLAGAISGKVSADDFTGATNTLSASLSAQIDTESPLFARSYTVTQQSSWTYDRANGTSIYFRPRYFGMRDGDLFKGVVLRTKDQNLTPFPVVYMRLKRYSDGAVLGVTDAVQYPNTPNTDVVFRLSRAVTLPSSGNYYVLDFATTPDGAAITQFGMRLYNLGSTTSPDCYFQISTLVPVMTAQFYSWASVVAPSAAAEEGQLADAKATGEVLDGKASTADAMLSEVVEWVPAATLPPDTEIQSVVYNAFDNEWVLRIKEQWNIYEIELRRPDIEDNPYTGAETQLSFGLDSGLPVTINKAVTYKLGSRLNDDKPLARAEDVEALRTGKANDNAVVHLTGDETVGGVKTFGSEGVVVHDPQTGFSMKLLDTGIAVTDGSDTTYFYIPSIEGGGGTFALLSDVMSKADRVANPTAGNLAVLDLEGNLVDSEKTPYDFALADIIAPEWDFNSTYEVGDLCTSFDNDSSHRGTWLYKCILAPAPQQLTPPETDPTHWALATVEDVLAALRAAIAGKADCVSPATDGDIAAFDANGNLKLSGMSRDGNGNLDATEFTFTPTQVVDYDSAAVGTVISKATTPVVLHDGQHYVVRKSFVKTNSGWSVDSVTGRVVLPGASGTGSTALGDATQATGSGAVSVGKNTKASGAGALSSGQETDAVGTGAHAEGQATSATATCAHSEGYFTIAQNQSEHAQGEYNASHTGATASEKTLNSIGIGDSNERKNAVEVMRDGKTFIYGLGGYDGTNPTDSTNLAAVVGGKANRAPNPTAGNLAALDANGNPVDSTIPAANVATKSDATLTELSGMTEWVFEPATYDGERIWMNVAVPEGAPEGWGLHAYMPYAGNQRLGGFSEVEEGNPNVTRLVWTSDDWYGEGELVATRKKREGYQLGGQDDKPLAPTESVKVVNHTEYTAWTVTAAGGRVLRTEGYQPKWSENRRCWLCVLYFMNDDTPYGASSQPMSGDQSEDATSIDLYDRVSGDLLAQATRTATPNRGYQIGDQSDKPLQPAGDYVPSSRTVNDQPLTSDVTLTAGDIKMQIPGNTSVKTAVDSRLMSSFVAPAFKTGQSYTAGTKVVYGSEVYEFTQDKAAGNWDSSVVKLLTVDDLLDGKAPYDWVASKLSEYRDKLDLNVYGYGNPAVRFADGFTVGYDIGGDCEQLYTAPSGGETITFVGPVPSSNQFAPNDKFYYPSSLGNLDSFDPNNYNVWCITDFSGSGWSLMYRTGPYYTINAFNSESPSMTLYMGEATGDAPVMTRTLGATGDTLAKVSQMNAALAGKQDALSAQQLANIAAVPNKLDKSGGVMTGDLELNGQDLEVRVGPEQGIDDQYARLSQRELQVSNGDPNDRKLAHYLYDRIQLQNGASSVTVGFPAANGTLALTAGPNHAGNLAALDANGNPVDSGKKPSDFLEQVTILDYGVSTWADFTNAYDRQGMVYLRHAYDPNNTNAFRFATLSYYLDRRNEPTKKDGKAEFLYYRSANKSGAAGDEAHVYTLKEWESSSSHAHKWELIVRPLYTPIYKNKTVDVSDPAKLAEVVSNVVEVIFGGTATYGP